MLFLVVIPETKKPAGFAGGLQSYNCVGSALTGLRRHARRMMMVMMTMGQRNHGLNASQWRDGSQSHQLRQRAICLNVPGLLSRPRYYQPVI